MTFPLSNRVQSMKPSATFALTAKAAELRAKGHDVIALTVGEPDYDTPENVKDAAIEALRDPAKRTGKYTPVDGLPALKDAIIEKFQRDNGLPFQRSEIIASTGAKQTLSHAMLAVLNTGDEVIMAAPYWVSYPEMTRLCDAEPVIVHTLADTRFLLTPETLKAAITPKTKLVILNAPCNPTGGLYTAQELEALAEILRQHPDILVISDDIYEVLTYPPATFSTLAAVAPDLRDRVLTVNGLSKSHAMTGWRLGYAGGPKPWVAAMRKLQGQTTSNPTTLTQHAAIAALGMAPHDLAPQRDLMQARRDRMVTAINDINGCLCLAPDGAFYLFVDISEAMAQCGYATDSDFAAALLAEHYVATVPGSAFGMEGHIRLSFALDDASLDDAIRRLSAFIED